MIHFGGVCAGGVFVGSFALLLSRMPDVQKPSLFEVLTRLLLPALSLVAFIVAQIRGQTIRWPLLAFIFLFIAVAFLSPLKAMIRRRLLERQKKNLAQHLFADLQGLVSHFGKFIASNSAETLHAVLQREAAFILGEMHVPNAELVYYPWYYLNDRLQRQPKTLPEFLGYLTELDSLVRGYINHYLFPVFDRMPEYIREKLSGSALRELAVFREQFVNFLNQCAALGERARPLLPERYAFFGFPVPRPLSGSIGHS